VRDKQNIENKADASDQNMTNNIKKSEDKWGNDIRCFPRCRVYKDREEREIREDLV
jgi:hypothetical protein